MAGNSEIEKLERRWRDNPQGTGFAPYAEALRKQGNHALAREVLRQGLENHPDHIPGNIVLGRCALDVGEDGAAEQAFFHALSLDQENVIALKALADITERQGRLAEAGTWLTQLITVDPSNDEAQEQLARISSAREVAAALMVSPLQDSTEPAPAPPPPAEVETGAGRIEDDVDSVLDAAFESHFPPARPSPAARPAPPAAEVHHVAPEAAAPEDATLPMIPVQGRPPLPLPDLETHEFEPAGAAGDVEELADFEPLQAFAPPAAEPPAALSTEEFTLEDEERPAPIELRPSGSSEFQAPDDSGELLAGSPGRSEFQTPDASTEISVRGSGGQEFQPPSGVDELLARYSSPAQPAPESLAAAPEAPPAEAPPAWASGGTTSGYASMPASPTEELPVDASAPAMTPAAWEIPVSEAVSAPVNQAVVAGPVVPESDAAASVPPAEPPAVEPPVAGTSDLQLIYPDELAQAAPSRLVQAPREAPPHDPAVGEPAPVLTESMAELYARQGHIVEALEVYRALLARSPRDARLAEKVTELEQAAAPVAARRKGYSAAATGGESVESFFRAMVEARPEGAPGADASRAQHRPDDGQPGAPTRPTSDPLSLSAIFGEDQPVGPAPAVSPAPPPGPAGGAVRTGGLPDAFSFDQFFGGPPGAPGGGPRAGPGGEDLDQFQNWLKSLKR